MIHEVEVFDRALGDHEVGASYRDKQHEFPEPLLLAAGPYVRFLDRAVQKFAGTQKTLARADSFCTRGLNRKSLRTQHPRPSIV
jgi:hypothetical protein